MKEILSRNAGAIGLICTAFFAYIMFWYASQWDKDVPVYYLILIGLALALFILLTLWSVSTTKITKKRKGKK